MRQVNVNADNWTDVWIYDCGWQIKGSHPYRMIFFGDQILDQPIGILQFYKETGILPPKTI